MIKAIYGKPTLAPPSLYDQICVAVLRLFVFAFETSSSDNTWMKLYQGIDTTETDEL